VRDARRIPASVRSYAFVNIIGDGRESLHGRGS
jgi:hypothetical protein